MLPKTFTVPPATLKIYIPFQIIDDNITEGDQGVKIHLKYRHHALFRVNTSSITITIEDNDGMSSRTIYYNFYCFKSKINTSCKL